MKPSAMIASAIFLGFMAETASATDWCTRDPLPPGTPVVCTKALRDNYHKRRTNDFIEVAWKNSDLSKKVWCKAKQDRGPEVYCEGIKRSDCGPYPYLMRNPITPAAGQTGIRISNEHEEDTRYVAIYADVKPVGTAYCSP